MSRHQNNPGRKISPTPLERKRAPIACLRCRKLHKRCLSESTDVRCFLCVKADKVCNYEPMTAPRRAHTIVSQPYRDSGIPQSSYLSANANQNFIARMSSHQTFPPVAITQDSRTQVYSPSPAQALSSSLLSGEIPWSMRSGPFDDSYDFPLSALSSRQGHSVEPSDTSRLNYHNYPSQLSNTPSLNVNGLSPQPPHLSHMPSLASSSTSSASATYLALGYEPPSNNLSHNGLRIGYDTTVVSTSFTGSCHRCQNVVWCPDHPNQFLNYGGPQ